MRKVIAGFASSLDGYIESADGTYDWILIDKEIDFAEQSNRYDTYFYGRKTYEAITSVPYAKNPTTTNYVFSNTLTSVHTDFILITNEIKKKVNELKGSVGKDIAVFGGASLLASLLDLQVVDEIHISIIPILLGKGKPMVDVLSENVRLQYLSNRIYSNGTVQIKYAIGNNHF
jgi:dihydrofolate reductase